MNWEYTNPRHYNPGLKQGFVRFGTLHHKILVLMHNHRFHATLTWLCTELPDATVNAVSMALTQLHRHSYIHRGPKVPPEKAIGGIAQYRWSLVPFSDRSLKTNRYKPKTPSQRQHKYRARLSAERKARVSSVFHFRGEIHVTPKV